MAERFNQRGQGILFSVVFTPSLPPATTSSVWVLPVISLLFTNIAAAGSPNHTIGGVSWGPKRRRVYSIHSGFNHINILFSHILECQGGGGIVNTAYFLLQAISSPLVIIDKHGLEHKQTLNMFMYMNVKKKYFM